MNRKSIILSFLFLFFAATAPAQIVSTTTDVEETLDFEDSDDTGEEEADAEDDAEEINEVSQVRTDSLTIVEGVALPASMEQDIDALLREWHSQQYLVEEDSQEEITDMGLVNAEVYTERLRRLPAGLELPYNPIVHRFIEQYAGRLRRSVSYMLGANNFYMPIFEEALEAYEVPLELKYLPVIESSVNPNAVSRVGATGLWQFMLTTGKRYDLEVNSLVDDRRDPIKASWAAAHYLHDLYNIYKDWTLVIAAYNCGPGNVNKAIHRANGSQDYWEIYPYLPSETRGYVPAFIAANYIMNYYCEHGIKPMQATLPLATDTVVVSQDLHFQQVADLCNLPIEQIRALNPQYRKDIVPGYWKPSTLCLPQESIITFLDCGDSIYTHRASELMPRRSTTTVNEASVAPAKTATKKRSSKRSSKKRSNKRRRR